jgi:thiosulfate dehydrogenase
MRLRSFACAFLIFAIHCMMAMVAGCTTVDPEVIHGTAIDHGAALFQDPSIANTTLNQYSCATCHEPAEHPSTSVILTGAPLAGAVKRPSYWGGQRVQQIEKKEFLCPNDGVCCCSPCA